MRRLVFVLAASVVFASVGLAFQAQPAQDKKPEKAPEAPAPAPSAEPMQDKVDFKDALDSWYKITQADGLHVGHSHVVLRRMTSGGPGRYSFDLDSELEVMVPDEKDPAKQKQTPSVESVRIRAHLDDTYAPIDWQQVHHLDNVDINTNISTDENGARKIDVVYSPTNQKPPFLVPEGDDVYYHRFLMFIALRQNGNLARQGPRKVALLHVQAEAARPFVDVDLSIEPTVKRPYLDKKEVSVTRVLYHKPPPSRSRDFDLLETYVDRYGRPVEEVLRGGMKSVLAKGEEEAVGKALLRQGARRDPFRKDLAMRLNAQGQGVAPSAPGKIGEIKDASSFEARFNEAKNLVNELKKAKEDNREREGDEIYHKILDYVDVLNNSLKEKQQSPEVANQVAKIRKDAEEIWGGVDRLMKKLMAVNVKVLEAFGRDDVDGMQKGLEELRKSQDAKELRDQPQLIELGGWIAKAEPLVAKAKTRLELAKKKVVLTGTISYEDWSVQEVDGSIALIGVQVGAAHGVRFIKPNRLAVINEKVYKVGDVVEGEGVRVEKIGANTVQVSLREETRDVGIRQ